MDRTMSVEDRVRRAEEIYSRRRKVEGIRVSTSNMNSSVRGKNVIYKKLILQILICFFLYLSFYLIKNSNYIFSESFINKTREILSYDINFRDTVFRDTLKKLSNNFNKDLKHFFNISIHNGNEITNEMLNEIVNGITNEVINEETNIITNEIVKETSAKATVKLSQMEIDANDIKKEHSLVLPLIGTISSRFGPREGNEIVSSNHAGIDIAANEGTVFVAAMSGEVLIASSEGSYGNHLFIQEGDVITIYAHCKKLYVCQGDKVVQGQELGEVGQTGNATGPHLHFEIRKDDRCVDPELILDFA